MDSHADDTLEIRRGDVASPTVYTVTTLPGGASKMCTPRPMVNPVQTDFALFANGTGPAPSQYPEPVCGQEACEQWRVETATQYGNTSYVLHVVSKTKAPVAQVITATAFGPAPGDKPKVSTSTSTYSGFRPGFCDPAEFDVPKACGHGAAAPLAAVPQVYAVDPAAGKEGDLIGIAGDAFANISDIVCRFGKARAPIEWFRSSSVVYAKAPPRANGADKVLVACSNDGQHFSSAAAHDFFTYTA